MDPGTATLVATVGSKLLEGMFGGGSSEPFPHAEGIYERFAEILDEQMRFYKSVNLEQVDAKVLSLVKELKMKETERALDAHDVRYGGSTRPDSERTRERTLIAKQGADEISQLAAQLESTRAQRQASFMPSPQGVMSGAGLAQGLDVGNMQHSQNQASSWAMIGNAIANLIPKAGKNSSGMPGAPVDLSNPNSGFGGGGIGDPMGLGGISTPKFKIDPGLMAKAAGA